MSHDFRFGRVLEPTAILPRHCIACLLVAILGSLLTTHVRAEFKAGAAVVNVVPNKLPVAINGGMTARFTSEVNLPVMARAVVLAQGETQIAMVVVDSCMMPRDLLDKIKQFTEQRTGIPRSQIMISATHTHSAPAAMSCLGTNADPDYQQQLRLLIADVVAEAKEKLQPAEVGWASCDASDYMAVRRWIRRPDRLADDPFGNPTVRANMHAGRNWDDVTGESGPEDPELSMISIRSTAGESIAVFANLSMHYFSGVAPIHADYFGIYCRSMQSALVASDEGSTQPVVMMSHGCSGDIWRRDYTGQTPERMETISVEDYANELVQLSLDALATCNYQQPNTVLLEEASIPLNYRTPDAQRLAWAKQIVSEMGDRLPKTQPEIYAREAIYLDAMQSTEVLVQVIRLGDIAVATTPTETYALTGLKIKLQSPAAQTMVLDLANGGDGYIPPPEQHFLGGYNTWPARSAGLEVNAEPKMVQSILQMLESAFQKPCRNFVQSQGPTTRTLINENPLAFWRLDEMEGPIAENTVSGAGDGYYEPGVVFFLTGPQSNRITEGADVNRCAHFAGGRMLYRPHALPDNYRVRMWIWNGMPTGGRDITGWFYSRGVNASTSDRREQLGIGGSGGHEGKLILQQGNGAVHAGTSTLERWRWYQVELQRSADEVAVYLDGQKQPEIVVPRLKNHPGVDDWIFVGGSNDSQFNFEGRVDEVAILEIP